ncbi:HAD family hydrolase [Paenibacillus herberti]|nr:HAD family hydrolase [Paenibacillus herberti]
MIRAILFDLDDTLLDRAEGFREFAERLADRYADVSPEERPQWIKRLIELDERGYKSKPQLFRELLEQLPCRSNAGWEELYAFYDQEYVSSSRLMPGARELLAALRPFYRLGIVTNGRDCIQRGKIERTGIGGWFETITISESAGCKKPHPGIFARALSQLGSSPEQTLFVGDHPVNDIQGAYFSGMKSVWLKHSQPWPNETAMLPDAVITELSQLPAAIRLVSGQTAASEYGLSSGA